VRDINDQVAEYRGLVESLARKFVGRNGAEHDDLVQEGLIHVWQALTRSITPAAAQIENRMKKYVRWLGRHSSVPYEEMLPIENVDDLTADPVWDVLA
jgi:DNA-directed RNA polymerase specialized sigma subunit